MKRKSKLELPKKQVLSSDNPKDRACMAAMPELSGATVMDAFSVYGGQDFSEVAGELRKRGDAVVDGNTKGMERMLISQAHALEAIFVKEARRASGQEYLPQFEAHLKLALRAQNQCRMTLETLATIKNPPVVFAKQANIANNQQVNNGEAVPAARAGETEKRQPELLEAPHAKPEWMDAGTARTATPSNTTLEAVGEVHRPANG